MSCSFIQVWRLELMRRNQPSPTNQRPPVQRELVKEHDSGLDLKQ